uniref:Uncharacterized protein n=1 Tax=Callorhinchus milii TaxID=7868 RepID=A0A4W3GJ31_CALMI
METPGGREMGMDGGRWRRRRSLMVLAVALGSLGPLLPLAEASNILVVPVDGSHWINMKVLMEALRARGHQLTVLRSSTSWYIKEKSDMYHSFTVHSDSKLGVMENHEVISRFVVRNLEIRKHGRTPLSFLRLTQAITDMVADTHSHVQAFISNIFEDLELLRRLEKAGFDLLLTDPLLPTGLMLAHRLKLPMVYNVRWFTVGDGHYFIAPSPISYVPLVSTSLTDRMSYRQRLRNAIQYFTGILLAQHMVHPSYDQLCHKYLGPGVDLTSLVHSADLWLMRVDFVFEFPRPSMPNMVYVGGFQCRPAKPLPRDLEDFVAGSGPHGVVFMSLGTLVTDLPEHLLLNIASAFARLPQRVVWRFPGQLPGEVGNNTLVTPWVPQNDLLGHPKTVAFVSHGGTNGLYEAIYHGVPVLGIPLIFDQFDNLVRLEARGAARVVDVTHLETPTFLEALSDVLQNSSYRENMRHLSELHRDQPETPLDRAMFWIEFVLRHKGAPHLRSASLDLPWAVYHSLDILATFFLTACLLLLLTALALRLLVRSCCRARKEKAE